jgi:hypothetical protein
MPMMFLQGATGFRIAASKELVPASQSARIEPIAGPMLGKTQPIPPMGPTWYLVKISTPQTIKIGLDNILLKNVIIQDAVISYQGGPVKLDHVIFVNCTFDISQGATARELASSVLESSTVTFSSPRG